MAVLAFFGANVLVNTFANGTLVWGTPLPPPPVVSPYGGLVEFNVDEHASNPLADALRQKFISHLSFFAAL
ncbi:MAG: hypothetical protein ABSE76_02690 [Minisyncoccia bacterium]